MLRNAIQEIQSKHEFLDGIFINAGLGYASKRVETEDGMDPHFQVNYFSQFMLTLNLLNLLEKSENGGRIIFNVTKGGEIFWDDMQMKKKWGYRRWHSSSYGCKKNVSCTSYIICIEICKDSKLTFIGFEISKTVWSNQLNIIPLL